MKESIRTRRAKLYIKLVEQQLDETTDPAKQRQLRASLRIFRKVANA